MQHPGVRRSSLASVKKAIRMLLALVISLGALNAHAQPREFNQAELDAVLAPIALYPDALLTNILNAALFPQDVAAAAAWSRANPQLQGDAALAAVEGEQWHPSVKALVPHPEVLARMAESPQWLADLGEAYSGAPAAVNAEIQSLRARAQASGNLQSNEQQYVYQQGQDIVVQPVYPQVMYVPYYNPYIVYGTWWWPAYRPVYWRPWVARPVYVTRVVAAPVRIVQPHMHPGIVKDTRFARPPVHVAPYRPIPESRRQPIIRSAPPMPQQHWGMVKHIPESQRQPIIRSTPPMPPQHSGIVKQVPRPAVAQHAPVMRQQQMPAPQYRATERPSRTVEARGGGNAFNKGGWSNGGGSRGNGSGGGHRRG